MDSGTSYLYDEVEDGGASLDSVFTMELCRTTSSSTRLLLFMVPLVVMVLVWPTKSSWFSPESYYHHLPSIGFKDFDRTAEDFRRSVGGETEKVIVVDFNGQSSATPLVAVEVRAEPPVVELYKDNVSPISNDVLVAAPSPNENMENVSIVNVVPTSTSKSRINSRFHNLHILEAKLKQARATIRESRNGSTINDSDYVPYGPVYHNPSAFHRSYIEMEKHFKVFVYNEGEHPIFHNGPCGSIYSMEGNFINKMETSSFRTKDPEKASVFFLPFSVTAIVRFIHDRNSREPWLPMKRTVEDYVDLIARRYPFWNRSLGSDHVMLACHDWGPELSKSLPQLFNNSIRALCNANTTEGFQPSKDVSIPEINLPGGRNKGLIGGLSASKRPILAFFAGGVHGPVRPILLEHWENKDQDIRVYQYLPKHLSYLDQMRKSKYCICPSGYEVASPRIVEALYNGCVPVLINDHYVPPFSDVLNWKSFAVEVPVGEIPNLKKILMGISTRQYIRMKRRGEVVRRHFEVNLLPKRYDVFHMTLHSIWLRRLNLRLHGVQDS